jgi:hypothetical protein
LARAVRILSVIVVAVFATLPALAADPDWVRPFRKYVNAPAYLDDIGRSIARLERRLAPECVQILEGMERLELRIVQPPVFIPGLPIPQGGQWREQVQINRCGEAAIHNVLVTAANGSTPFMTVLLPGTSKADGRLQLDASSAAFAIAGARARQGCELSARHIIRADFDSWLEGTGSSALPERVWREIWTIRLCGETVRVQVDFSPDGKGGFTHQADLPRRSG